MTVANRHSVNKYRGNGVTTHWPYTFTLPEASGQPDASVVYVYKKVGDAVTAEVPRSEFTINLSAKEIIYPPEGRGLSPIGSDTQLFIYRILDETQLLDLRNGGEFFAEDIESSFDRNVMLVQQLSEELERAVVLPPGTDTTPLDWFEENIAAAKTAADRSQAQADRSYSEADRSRGEADRAKTEADRSGSYVSAASAQADRARDEADRATTQATASADSAAASQASADASEISATASADSAADSALSANESELSNINSATAAADSAESARLAAESVAGHIGYSFGRFRVDEEGNLVVDYFGNDPGDDIYFDENGDVIIKLTNAPKYVIGRGRTHYITDAPYSDTTTYVFLDAVEYNGDWYTHIATTPTTGVAPTDNKKVWMVSSKGERGIHGTDITDAKINEDGDLIVTLTKYS